MTIIAYASLLFWGSIVLSGLFLGVIFPDLRPEFINILAILAAGSVAAAGLLWAGMEFTRRK